mmetsp:Transcript_17213/g.43197  ORF Transcript_17213/g.43197 Transcript_17213/m.43197 type:complete len:228 (+) Transcript_17213:1202-1885(+)
MAQPPNRRSSRGGGRVSLAACPACATATRGASVGAELPCAMGMHGHRVLPEPIPCHTQGPLGPLPRRQVLSGVQRAGGDEAGNGAPAEGAVRCVARVDPHQLARARHTHLVVAAGDGHKVARVHAHAARVLKALRARAKREHRAASKRARGGREPQRRACAAAAHRVVALHADAAARADAHQAAAGQWQYARGGGRTRARRRHVPACPQHRQRADACSPGRCCGGRG